MSKELSLNILELAKKVQKLEATGMPDTYPAEQVTYDHTESGLSATYVQEAIDEVASELEKIAVKSATITVTGVSGNWAYMNVTFLTPFKKQPLVTVNQFDTGSGNNWCPPILKNITVNGFTAGWYSVTGTKEFIWQAIGVV